MNATRGNSKRWSAWLTKNSSAKKIIGVRSSSMTGQAMIAIIIVLMLLMMLPLALYSTNSASQSTVTTNTNSRLAWTAANSGMTDYRNLINQNLSFTAYNDVSDYAGAPPPQYNAFNYAPGNGPPETATTPSCTGAYTQVVSASASSPGRIIDWQPVKGTSFPVCEHYTYSVNARTVFTTDTITITATGEAGPPGRIYGYKAVSSTFTKPNLDYALNTNFNAVNPAHSTLESDVNVLIAFAGLFGLLGSAHPTQAQIRQVVDFMCIRYAGQPVTLPLVGTIYGPFPGCPVDTWEAGWSWNGGLPNPIMPSTWSIGQYFSSYQDTINGNVRSNDGFYYCSFPPDHLVNWVQLAINAFSSNWGSLIIDAVLFAVFWAVTGLSPLAPNINGKITAGVATSGGGGGQTLGTVPGLPNSLLDQFVAGAAGWPGCPSTPPNFNQGQPTLGKSLNPLPSPNPNLEYLASQNGSPIRPSGSPAPESPGGCLYSGPTVIQLNPDGTMTVWNPDSVGVNNTGRDGCPSNGGTAALPANGVVYVQNLQSGGCQPFPNPPFTGLNYGYGTSQSNPIQQSGGHSSSNTCNLGNAIVQGTLNGRLTIAAQNNVVITNSIYYAGANCPGTGSTAPPGPQCTSLLGLTAQGNVEINHPQNQNLNTVSTILNYISDVCTVIDVIAGILAITGVGIPGAVALATACLEITFAANLFLLYVIGRNATDCPVSGYNSCSNYGTSGNPADDDTTNPNVLFPDPGEASWWAFDEPWDMFIDFLDGTVDLVVCGECVIQVQIPYPCSVNNWGFSINWCHFTLTLWNEAWSDWLTGESDNSQMNGGTWNFFSLFSSDGDPDNICIPNLGNIPGTIDALWDWVMNGAWGEPGCSGFLGLMAYSPNSPSWWIDEAIDWLTPDTNFPSFYGSSGDQAVINADILTVGGQNPTTGQYPSVTTGSPTTVCPSWNQNCGMFKLNNSQAGMALGQIYVNGAVTEYYGGRLTGQCQSLANLFNTVSSTLPFMNCISNSGYYVDLTYDNRLVYNSPPNFYGASSPAQVSQLIWSPVSTAVVISAAEKALVGTL
ncbi:MAG: hypothetical protein ACYDGY_07630 [Acidimicrobiales bacterium]